MLNACPGAAGLKGAPTLKIKLCPVCGAEIEIFSKDLQVKCECGFIAYNSIISCIQWCKYARECVGDETYEMLTAQWAKEREDSADDSNNDRIPSGL